MAIIPDTLQGAIVLSCFDFIACFFVLWGISGLVRLLGVICKRFPEGGIKKPEVK